MKVGKAGVLSTIALEATINEEVGNSMTTSEYFDPTLNTVTHVTNKKILDEAYRQNILSRLLILNCKHKLVENSIKHAQTHTQSNANVHVPLIWLEAIPTSLATIMMIHNQQTKQKNRGNKTPRKNNNPRKERRW